MSHLIETLQKCSRPLNKPSTIVLPPGSRSAEKWARVATSKTRSPSHYNEVYGYVCQWDSRKSSSNRRKPAKRMNYSTLQRIRDGDWLNDEIINGFLSLPITDCERNNVLVLSSSDMRAVESFGRERRMRLFAQSKICSNLVDVRKTIFPHNVGNNHWILLTYDHSLNVWLTFDSIDAIHGNTAKKYHLILMDMMGYVPPFPEFVHQKGDIPKHIDDYQCGVWTCIAGLCVITGHVFPENTEPYAFAREARKFIAMTMYTNNITLDETLPDLKTSDAHYAQTALTFVPKQ